MVNQLKECGVVTSSRVEEVMRKVDRGNYVAHSAYYDAPQGIGSNVTISAPHMHSFALTHLEEHLKPGMKVLDVGCGSGYLTACMAHMVGPTGKVVGIDHIDVLVKMSRDNITKDCPALLEGTITLITGDGREGYAPLAPYDAIHVGAAAPQMPKALMEQLKEGGRMIIPVGGADAQYIEQVDKSLDGKISREKMMGVRYVPLTSKEKQLRD